MRRVPVVLAAIVLGFAATVAVQQPVAAHTVCAYHGLDNACAVGGHFVAEVYDVECDGNGVFGVFNLRNGASISVGDTNGCVRGGGSAPTTSEIVSLYVCENGSACSETVRVT